MVEMEILEDCEKKIVNLRSVACSSHQGGIKFKPELRVRNQDYGGMKVDHFVVEKR